MERNRSLSFLSESRTNTESQIVARLESTLLHQFMRVCARTLFEAYEQRNVAMNMFGYAITSPAFPTFVSIPFPHIQTRSLSSSTLILVQVRPTQTTDTLPGLMVEHREYGSRRLGSPFGAPYFMLIHCTHNSASKIELVGLMCTHHWSRKNFESNGTTSYREIICRAATDHKR